MKKLLMAATAVTSVLATPAMAGNGAPSGKHFNLNIIGVDARQDRPDNAAGHVIFVDLDGPTRILLNEGAYAVLDKDGTDGVATFQLPNPDEDGDGTTTYSVYARALGAPGGSSSTRTCFEEGGITYCSTDNDGEPVTMELTRSKGPSKFTNVSKYLLFVYADLDGDPTTPVVRVPLFDDDNDDFWWDYTNDGLRLAQLRFYECETTAPDDPADPISTTC